MFMNRRRRNRSWLFPIIGVAAAYFVGREAGKRDGIQSENGVPKNNKGSEMESNQL